MTNIIGRVAHAICLAESRNPFERRTLEDGTILFEWELRAPAARAAIEAMQEPSEAMIDEGLIGYGGGELELRLRRKGIKLAFQAMIIEALK